MYNYNIRKHPVLNTRMITLWQEEDHNRPAEISLLPDFGSNLCSYRIDGIEYLHQAPMPNFGIYYFGTPILYPFPNRIRNRKMSFDGVDYQFHDDDHGHTLHAFIRDHVFEMETPVITDENISVKTVLTIEKGHPIYAQFPIANRLEMRYMLERGELTFSMKVTNLDSHKRFPFGFGIHPYFNVLGTRSSVKIQVPAKKWMDKINLLPTGKLVELKDAPVDISQPQPLSELDLDDVWFGMEPDRPQSVFYECLHRKLVMHTSDIFTHSVTYTPAGQPFFCMENQTCSTDAVNLSAAGKEKEAHLLILDPGESIEGWVRFSIESL